ncbi:hypothetical protein PGB90_010349 [Kerria lacca]
MIPIDYRHRFGSIVARVVTVLILVFVVGFTIVVSYVYIETKNGIMFVIFFVIICIPIDDMLRRRLHHYSSSSQKRQKKPTSGSFVDTAIKVKDTIQRYQQATPGILYSNSVFATGSITVRQQQTSITGEYTVNMAHLNTNVIKENTYERKTVKKRLTETFIIIVVPIAALRPSGLSQDNQTQKSWWYCLAINLMHSPVSF